jgi:hypothetical protein
VDGVDDGAARAVGAGVPKGARDWTLDKDTWELDAPATHYAEWRFDGIPSSMPEAALPKLGKVSSVVTMDVDPPESANGVVYALGGFAGGLALYVKDGILTYEFNLFEVRRTTIRAANADSVRRGELKRRGRGMGST